MNAQSRLASIVLDCVLGPPEAPIVRLMGMGVAGRNDILPDVEHGFALGQKVKFEN